MLMKLVGYGTKGLDILILDTCNILESKDWLMFYQASISAREYVRDVFLENALKRNSTKESVSELLHLYS
jgi:hypothetical protein